MAYRFPCLIPHGCSALSTLDTRIAPQRPPINRTQLRKRRDRVTKVGRRRVGQTTRVSHGSNDALARRKKRNRKRQTALSGRRRATGSRRSPNVLRPDSISQSSQDPLVLILAYTYGKDRHIRQTLRACNGRYCGGSHAYVRRSPTISALARDCESSASIHYSE